MLSSERRLAEKLVAMMSSDWRGNLSRADSEEAVDRAIEDLSINRDESQREAAIMAVSSGLSVITGGPGTGKTTTQRLGGTALGSTGLEVALTATTGRADKRLGEDSGAAASP